MLTIPKIKSNAGQSLLEVVVAISVVVLVLATMISAISYALSNAQYARNKALATKYAQEAVEWLRTQRDVDWYAFYGYAGSWPDGNHYCLSSLAWTNIDPCISTEANDKIPGTPFLRDLTFTQSQSLTDRTEIAITVSWPQGTQTPTVMVNTYLTKWK